MEQQVTIPPHQEVLQPRKVVVQAQALSTGYIQAHRATVVHEKLDFNLYAGELTCLLGCNGAGKSTLLRTIAAGQPPLSGTLTIHGIPVQKLSSRMLSRTIGVVFTESTQAGGLTVFELVALGRQPYTGFFGRLSQEDKTLVARAIDKVGITHKMNAYVANLSDGERQKAMIAKALVQQCPLIILDEPTAFLDVVSRIEVMQLLRTLAREENRAVLVSTHDVDQAVAQADSLWLMTADGQMLCGPSARLVHEGMMERLFHHPMIHFDEKKGNYSL